MAKYTFKLEPVITYKWQRVELHRVKTHSEKISFYDAVYQWNRRKTFKTFKKLYKHEFIGFNPISRVYHIFKHTVNGRYKELENELEKNIIKER